MTFFIDVLAKLIYAIVLAENWLSFDFEHCFLQNFSLV